MAEAILNHLGNDRFCAMSAGDQAVGQIHPMALTILTEHGVPTTTLKSKSWARFFGLAAPRLDFIIIVCDESPEKMVLRAAPTNDYFGNRRIDLAFLDKTFEDLFTMHTN